MSDPDLLQELRVRPSMNGLTATVHGKPDDMRRTANAVFGLTTLTVIVVLLALLVRLENELLVLMGGAGSLLMIGIFARTLRDFIARFLQANQQSVTVLEMTPRRLLINRTAAAPRSISLSDIHTVRQEDRVLVLVLEGEQPMHIDARQNSAAAVDWLHSELSLIITDAGTPTRPPEALQEMLHRASQIPEANHD